MDANSVGRSRSTAGFLHVVGPSHIDSAISGDNQVSVEWPSVF